MNTTAHTKASLQVFTAAFFTIAQGWEQSKYPLTGKRPNCVTSTPRNTSQQQKGMNWDTRIRLDESPGNCAKWKKKPVPKGYILYDYNYITTSKCQNYRNVERISDCQEWGEGGGEEERVWPPKEDPCQGFYVLTMSMPVPRLWYWTGSARCYLGEKPGKWFMASLYYYDYFNNCVKIYKDL